MKSSKKNNLKGFAKQKKKTTIKRMIVKFNMKKNNGE
jgi:hypothetical protein